ncbi:MAG: FHA domain-containing protein [Planctomycetaceae bacterium]|nr:FHA domain-containing protein [Planctomycetaceae bacterium]
MLSVELHVIGGKHSGQVIKLNHKKFLIGREQDCHLRPNSELVSRHHCIFTVDDFSVRLRDLGSTNGTMVNGDRLRKEVVLQPNDLVLVGNLEFKILINDGHAAPEAPESKPLSQEETAIVGTETLAEMAPISAAAAMEAAAAEAQETTAAAPAPEPVPAPTAEAPAAEAAPPAPAPGMPQMPQMPQVGSGDTTIISTPMMMPGQPAYQPMMPQQMGYPPMYQGYPGYPPQMPGQMPMYPQGMPGQPAPGYPMQPPQQATPVPTPEPAAPAAEDAAEVSLPDPASTGVKEAPPAAESAPAGGGQQPQEQKSNDSAAAIIQKHMHRRPGG